MLTCNNVMIDEIKSWRDIVRKISDMRSRFGDHEIRVTDALDELEKIMAMIDNKFIPSWQRTGYHEK